MQNLITNNILKRKMINLQDSLNIIDKRISLQDLIKCTKYYSEVDYILDKYSPPMEHYPMEGFY